jgi:leucyl-tRNA synthetase
MGYDAFGLPAEQYAIQTGVKPQVSTEQNIKRYRQQLDNLGFCYDWSREVRTSDPEYYKWTQWIFIRLFEHYYDLVENKARSVEDLVAKFSELGSKGVFAFNDYQGSFDADEWNNFSPKEKNDILMHFRLAYKGQAFVNWCEELGTVLANDEVKDGVSERGGYPVVKKPMEQWFLRITAYAERLLLDMQSLEWTDALKTMQDNWIGKSTGAQVFFDVADNDEKIEIFTTRPDTIFGATFIVLAPEHELVQKLTKSKEESEVIQYTNYVKKRTERERISETKQITGAFTGSYAIHPFTKELLPIWTSEYVLKDYGSGAIMAVPAGDLRDKAFAEKFGLPIIEIIDRSEFAKAEIEDKVGKMINSDFLNGLQVKDAISLSIEKIVEKNIGKARVNYKLRDANFSRQRYWGEPFPIKYDLEGISHTLADSELPLILPELEDFKPGDKGQSPLSRINDWVNLDKGFRRETDTMPGFAGSSWYFLRYMDTNNNEAFVGEAAINYWQDVDLYVGGTEHAVGHLMYARFWHKFLFDIGKVPTSEPFKKLINQGMIQGRSNFVFRAKENFYEEFLKIKVLDVYFSELGVVRVSNNNFEEENYADWGFEKSDLVIEVVSWKQK